MIAISTELIKNIMESNGAKCIATDWNLLENKKRVIIKATVGKTIPIILKYVCDV